MFIFSLPSALLTLDIEVEEADSAPMEDGALLLSLDVNRGCREDLRWAPLAYAGALYDAALLPFGRVYAWRSDCQYIPASALYLTDTCTPFRWDTIYPLCR